MPDEPKPADSLHLTVLPNSGKIEQLRSEFAAEAKTPEPKKLAERRWWTGRWIRPRRRAEEDRGRR
jgi:hypothetical protein